MGGGSQREGYGTVSRRAGVPGQSKGFLFIGVLITQWQPSIMLCTMRFMISGSFGALKLLLVNWQIIRL
jgi:hypothetical protein